MSKFWAEDSTSDSEVSVSDAEESGYDESEEGYESGSYGSQEGSEGDSDAPVRARFDFDEDWDEYEVDERRIVRTAKQKFNDEAIEVVERVRQLTQEGAWNELLSQVKALQDVVSKYSSEVRKSGVPGFVVKCFAQLRSTVDERLKRAKSDSEYKSSFSTTDWRALNGRLRQQLPKYLRTPMFVDLVKQYKSSPEDARWEDPADEDEEEDDGEAVEETARARRGTREFWVKQAGDESSSEDSGDELDWSDEVRDRAPDKGKADVKPKTDEDAEDAEDAPKRKTIEEKMAEAEARARAELEREYTDDEIESGIVELTGNRGKTGNASIAYIQRIKLFGSKARNDSQRFRLIVLLVHAYFDSVPNRKGTLAPTVWTAVKNNILFLMVMMRKHSQFHLVDELTVKADVVDDDEDDSAQQKGKQSQEGERVESAASLLFFLELLERDLTRALKKCDSDSEDYSARLADEEVLLSVAHEMRSFYDTERPNADHKAKVTLIIMEHMYYKSHTDIAALMGDTEARSKCPRVDYCADLERMFHCVYADTQHKPTRARALLCTVYHRALNNHYQIARDRLFMSQLNRDPEQYDPRTQVLYNRTVAQIGLCAFRHGLLRDAHSSLSELYAGGRVRELLAQGTSSQRYQDKDSAPVKAEKERMLPHHMHISLDLLETVHLSAACVLEAPNMAAAAHEPKRKPISKYLRSKLDWAERAVFDGPPESNRDRILCASRALRKGNWSKALNALLSATVWADLSEDHQTAIKHMLTSAVKESAFKTYLLTYGPSYDSLSLNELCQMFDLESDRVCALSSRMIANESLSASWHSPTHTLVMHRSEPSRLQQLSLQFSDKVTALVENNERLLDSKTGVYGSFHKHDSRANSRSRRDANRSRSHNKTRH